MTAGFLSTYQQYKSDTDVVVSWLAATAKQHGYAGTLAAPSAAKKNAASSSGRLKGKARKEAKQQQQHGVTSTSASTKDTSQSPPKPKSVLAIRDFVPLAEFIASKLATTTPAAADNDLTIPSFFSKALKRAISVRKAFSARLGEAQQHLDEQANAMHAYFIGVLEKVSDVLLRPKGDNGHAFDMAAVEDAMPAARGGVKKETGVGDFNLFDVLQVYEPSEEFLRAPDVVVPRAASSLVALEYTAEEDFSEAECMFAFTALLKDFINLGEEVSSLWAGYRSGKLSLAAAAVGANTAIELARSMEEEITPLLKRHGGIMALLPRLFSAACEARGLYLFDKELPTDDMNFACYEIGSAFLYNAASLLEAVRTQAPHGAGSMPRYNGKFGWYDAETAHFETMDNRQRWAGDKAAMLEVVSDFVILFALKGIPVHGEFACGVKLMFDKQETPLWLCFAAQNYLDTLHFFGPGLARPLAEFYRFNKVTAGSLDLVTAPKRNNAVKDDLKDLRTMVTVKKNDIDIFTAYSNLSQGTFDESTMRPSPFLKHNPVFTGLWINYARVLFHQTGIRYAAKPGTILHAVQLYTAVRQQQQQRNLAPVPHWSDMDRLLAMQGHQAFFVGGEPPATPEAHFKNYCMSRAVSPVNWLPAESRRRFKNSTVPVARSGAGVRELRFQAPASMWCAARVEKRETAEMAKRVWNAEVLQHILEASGWFEKQEQEQARREGGVEAETQVGATAGKAGKAKAKAKVARPTLTAPELVRHVAHAVQAEMPDLVFNFFVLHDTAHEMLERLQTHGDSIGLPRMPYVIHDMADVAGLVLSTLARDEEGKVLVEVAKKMDKYVTVVLKGCDVTAGQVAEILTIEKSLQKV